MRERRGPTLRGPENLQDQNLEIRKRGRCDQRKPRNSLKKPRKTQEEGGLDTIEREDFKQDRVANCVESKKMLSKLLNLSQKLCVCVCSVASNFLQLYRLWTARLLCPSKNTRARVPFLSRGSSQPRDQTHVFCISCIGGQILYHCATWEAPSDLQNL